MSTPLHPVPGEGTTLGYSLTLPAVTYTILSTSLITGIEVPDIDIEPVDTTALTALAETARPGEIIKNGDMTISLFYDPNDAGVIAMETLAATPALAGWQITFNAKNATTQPTWVFTGFVKSFKRGKAEKNKNFDSELVIHVSGTITQTPGV